MTDPVRLRAASVLCVSVVIAALMAGCSNEPAPTTPPAPSAAAPTATPVPANPAQDWEDQGGIAPDPSAQGTTPVTSLGGLFAAEVPASWGSYPPQVATDAMADPGVVDVLGLWLAGVTAPTEHSIVIMAQEREDPPLDAAAYYEANFSESAQPTLTIDHEIFTSAAGYEVLLIDINTEPDSGFAEESVFFVFTDFDLVVGLLSSQGTRDEGFRNELRAVADSVTVQ